MDELTLQIKSLEQENKDKQLKLKDSEKSKVEKSTTNYIMKEMKKLKFVVAALIKDVEEKDERLSKIEKENVRLKVVVESVQAKQEKKKRKVCFYCKKK